MKRLVLGSALALIAAVTACSNLDPITSTPPGGTQATATGAAQLSENAQAAAKGAGKISNTTGIWKIPLVQSITAGTGAFLSDGLFPDGGYSDYANGVCTVSTTIFYAGSGDATIQTNAPKGHSCGREFTYVYPDGTRETLANYPGVFNLTLIESSTYNIPIGTTVPRHLNLGKTARCAGIHFGVGMAGLGGGSDSVLVTRVNSTTWQVASQAAPNNLALCENTGELMPFNVNFRVVSNTVLP